MTDVLVIAEQELLVLEGAFGQELLEVVIAEQELLDVATQGPPGPTGAAGLPGAPGAPGGAAMTATAGEALGGNRAVVIDQAMSARYADNTNPLHLGRLAGITQGAAASGDAATIISFGPMTEPSWAWSADAPVYLSGNGLLTQTPPVTGFLQIVGIALSAITLFINPREPLVTN